MKRLILRDKRSGVRAKGFTVHLVDGDSMVTPVSQLPPRWVEQTANILQAVREIKLSKPKGRRRRLYAAHGMSGQQLQERPLTNPEDWLQRHGLPKATAVMPARAPEFGADVKTPLAQAGVSGGIVTGGLFALASAGCYFLGFTVDAYINSGIVAGLAGIGVFAYQWFGIMGKNRSTLWAMEMMLNQDLNGDRFVGEPVPRNEPRAIPISTSKRDGVIEVENGSEITGYSWRSFAVAVMCHRVNISKEKITKATADPAFPYEKVSQPQYLLIYGNLQANRYMSGGNYLTGAGWLYLSRWVPQGHDITLPFPEDAS